MIFETCGELMEPSDDPNLGWAINEYESHLDPADLASFIEFKSFGYEAAGHAISEMAMLIAAAKTLQDDAEFERIAEQCFDGCLLDGAVIRKLRNFYFRSADQIDFPPEFSVIPTAIVDERIARWSNNYRMLCPASENEASGVN
jgi:hypothetical protein